MGSRVHRAGQHRLRTDRHRNRHGNRRWRSDRHGQPRHNDSGNGFNAVLASIFSQSATVGTPFSLTFSAATGGDPPLTYSLSGEPSWLTLSGFTLSGTPDATGTHQVRVTVEDDDGDTDFRAFIITVSAAADLTPSLPAIANQTATVGTAFSLTFNAATGGDTPLSYSVSGNPAWLTLSTRTLSGTPTATGTHTVIVTVEDDDGDTDSSSFTLTVSAAAVLLTLADFSIPSGHEEVDVALITSGLDNKRLALQHRFEFGHVGRWHY